jgi:hypothetical protein
MTKKTFKKKRCRNFIVVKCVRRPNPVLREIARVKEEEEIEEYWGILGL